MLSEAEHLWLFLQRTAPEMIRDSSLRSDIYELTCMKFVTIRAICVSTRVTRKLNVAVHPQCRRAAPQCERFPRVIAPCSVGEADEMPASPHFQSYPIRSRSQLVLARPRSPTRNSFNRSNNAALAAA